LQTVQPSVLFVEDEEALRMTVGDRLRTEGYLVDYAADGDEAFTKATQLPFDLIILDLMLPRRDGLTVCRDIRDAGLITPILMLTARGQTADKVAGLKTGADDYVTKPFNMQELVARIEALLRRAPARAPQPPAPYTFGPITVDRRGTRVLRDGAMVNLSAREFQLLLYFIDHAGTTLTREELLTHVWGYNAKVFTRTVDVHVASLRHKLEIDPKQPTFIVTVQRIGYKFTPTP
jgi:two-component system alkaline phosphatase synthesis response regulator PhoP